MIKKLLLIFLLLLAKCSIAPFHKYYLSPTFNDVQLDTLVLAPMNLFSHLPDPLDGKTGPLVDSLKNYLSWSNKKIKSEPNFMKIWREEVYRIGGIFDQMTGKAKIDNLSTATKRTIKKVCIINRSDGVIIPQLIVRKARLAGRVGSWDGVSRDVHVNSRYTSRWDYSWQGNGQGLSLQIMILTKNGEKIFKSFGGIEMFTKFEADSSHREMTYRKDLLNDGDQIMKGIEIALHPFIQMKNYPNKPNYHPDYQ